MSNEHPNAGIALKTGGEALDFALADTDGQIYRLPAALGEGPVVLVFYRGDW